MKETEYDKKIHDFSCQAKISNFLIEAHLYVAHKNANQSPILSVIIVFQADSEGY